MRCLIRKVKINQSDTIFHIRHSLIIGLHSSFHIQRYMWISFVLIAEILVYFWWNGKSEHHIESKFCFCKKKLSQKCNWRDQVQITPFWITSIPVSYSQDLELCYFCLVPNMERGFGKIPKSLDFAALKKPLYTCNTSRWFYN